MLLLLGPVNFLGLQKRCGVILWCEEKCGVVTGYLALPALHYSY